METVVQALEAESRSFKFTLLRKTELRTKLLEKGISIDQEYWCLEFFEPDLTKKVLMRNPQVGVYLPGKVVVYPHNEKQHTIISFFLPTQVMTDEIEQVIDLFKDWESKMIQLIKQVQSSCTT